MTFLAIKNFLKRKYCHQKHSQKGNKHSSCHIFPKKGIFSILAVKKFPKKEILNIPAVKTFLKRKLPSILTRGKFSKKGNFSKFFPSKNSQKGNSGARETFQKRKFFPSKNFPKRKFSSAYIINLPSKKHSI